MLRKGKTICKERYVAWNFFKEVILKKKKKKKKKIEGKFKLTNGELLFFFFFFFFSSSFFFFSLSFPFFIYARNREPTLTEKAKGGLGVLSTQYPNR